MSQMFSTELVPASDRLDAWRLQASLVCGSSRFQFPRQRLFRGVIDRRSIGPLQITQFSSTPVSFAKYPTVAAKAPDRGCIIITQVTGIREYSQGQQSVTLQPGDTTLIDTGLPWSSTCDGHCSRLYLRLPRWLVEEKLQVSNLPLARRIAGRGLGATLFHMATSLYEEAGVLSMEEGVAAVEAYLHLLSTCIRGPEPLVRPVPDLNVSVERFIDRNLADPNLTLSAIAGELGISVRHLHRLFLKRGITVSEHIRQRRLEQCRAELADSRFIERNITEIAFSWGFSDSAHFSHCFRKQFGVSPREFRMKYSAASARQRLAASSIGEEGRRPN